jgi:hypothetical protein
MHRRLMWRSVAVAVGVRGWGKSRQPAGDTHRRRVRGRAALGSMHACMAAHAGSTHAMRGVRGGASACIAACRRAYPWPR